MTDHKTETYVDWPEVKETYLDIMSGKISAKAFHGVPVQRYRDGSEASFVGCNPAQMTEWVMDGFKPDNEITPDFDAPVRPARRLRFAEEGELDVTLLHSGHDYPWLDWEKRERKPGIRVIAEFCFSAFVNAEIIQEYAYWIGQMLAGLETAGYDMEVNIGSTAGSLYVNSERNSVDTVLLRVKREGEALDMREWSALFSPGGYRCLIFLGVGCAAGKLGTARTTGGGRPLGNAWSVDWDPESRTLHIQCNSRPSNFPAAEMQAQVDAAVAK